MTHRWLIGLLLLAACSGNPGAGAAAPVHSARDAVSEFFQAAADSDVAKMAALWGTAKGPASITKQPDDWARRVQVMQVYLRNSRHRVLPGQQVGTDENHAVFNVEFQRDECTITVPVTAVQTDRGSWVVNSVDLARVGTPGRPCPSEMVQP